MKNRYITNNNTTKSSSSSSNGSSSMSYIKGNNGKAARRRVWYRRLAYLCSTLCVLLVVLFLLEALVSLGTSSSSSGGNRNDRRAAFRHEWLNKRAKAAGGNLRNKGANDDDDDNDPNMDKELVLKHILEGRLSLIDVEPNTERLRKQHGNADDDPDYRGLFRGVFCHVDWSSHEADPSLSPMFRDVIAHSNCREEGQSPSMDLYQVVQAVRQLDEQVQKNQDETTESDVNANSNSKTTTTISSKVHNTQLSGVVFHESRCGSTLLANLMQWHSPEENLVYSESAPPVTILRTFDNPNLSQALGQRVLRDVVHLMGRTSLPRKRRLFFKIQSIGTLSLPLWRQTFPDTPWLFVYRDPVEVLMSHLEQGGKHANCVRSKYGRQIPAPIKAVVAKYGTAAGHTDASKLYTEGYCAAHLATLSEMAAEQLAQDTNHHIGAAVNYKDLPHLFLDTILPHVWKVDVDNVAHARMLVGSTSYSKGRGDKAGQEFTTGKDSEHKQKAASDLVKTAAATFLQPSYQALEEFAARDKRAWAVTDTA